MGISIDVQFIKRYVCENKEKCLKITGITVILIIALTIFLTNSLTKDNNVTVIDTSSSATITSEVENEKESEIELETKLEVVEEFIIIDIEGAVKIQGVVRLPAGSRVNDAVNVAGGLTADANTRNVNLAARLTDGDKVYIPKHGETDNQNNNSAPAGIITNSVNGGSQSASNGGNSSNTGITADGKVNINTATSEQLQTLSGVGPVTAQKIIEYRETVGAYSRIEDIMRVSGIGTRTFENLKNKITV